LNLRQRILVWSLMASHVCIASGGFIFVKVALHEFNPLALGFWRLSIGLVALVAFSAALGKMPRIDRSDWGRIALLAFLAVPINQVGYIIGMNYTVPTHAAILYGSTAVFAILFSTLLGHEKLRRSRIVAICMSVAGVVIVVSGSRTVIAGSENFAGDLLVGLGMIAWAAYTALAKPIVLKYGALRAMTVCLIIGTFMGLPFLIYSAIAQDYSVVTWRGWGGAAYAAVLLTCVAYAIWFTLLKKIDPSQVAVVTSGQPVVTTALSTWILGEVISANLVIGGLLVISGLVIMNAPELYHAVLRRRRPK
jgi:drug/metabolite transporter (DMT)-like permease